METSAESSCRCPSGERCRAEAQKKRTAFGSFKRCGLCHKRKPFRRVVECTDCRFVYHRRCQKLQTKRAASAADLSPPAAVDSENAADDLSSSAVAVDRGLTCTVRATDESANPVPMTYRPPVPLDDLTVFTNLENLRSELENRSNVTTKHRNTLDRGHRAHDPMVVQSKFGIVSTCVGHPMDTVKVIQQVTNTGVINATRTIYNRDKFAGYFRGMMFPILSTGLVNSVFFGVNGNVMRSIQIRRHDETAEHNVDANVRFCCDARHLSEYWHFDVFVSGCVAGIFYSAINIPSEVVKTMLQASNISTFDSKYAQTAANTTVPSKITSPTKLLNQLYEANGIRSIYRGGTLLMMRDVPSMGVYMLTYEHVCCALKQLYNEIRPDNRTESMPRSVQIVSGGLAGVASWVLVLPFDVIKSKIIADNIAQPLYRSVWDCVKKTYAAGGTAQFFQGFWLICTRAFPVNCVSFLVYETCLNACGANDS